MRTIFAVILWCALASCARSSSDTTKRTAESPQAADDDSKAGPGPAPQLVSIDMPKIVARSVELDGDGSFVWGEPEPIDGAEVCAIERRAAFGVYEPYEPLDPPICVTSQAGERPLLSGLPAHSDFTITITKDGYVPTATTQRVEGADLLPADDVLLLQMLLFTEEQASHFAPPPEPIDAPNALDADRGLLAVEYSMLVLGSQAPGEERGQLLSGPAPAWFFLAEDGQLALNVEPDGDALELSVPANQLLFEVPPGLYRAKVSHARVSYCEALGAPFAYSFFGLTTAEPGELEVRVLPGHFTLLEPLCFCVSPVPGDVPIDASSCVFADPVSPDAGAPVVGVADAGAPATGAAAP